MLSVAVLERFSCLYVTLRCDLELWPRDLNLWPWTFVVCRLCHGQTVYQIWAKSGNPRRSYCSLNFDLITLNMYHVLPLCSGIVCTKFKLSQAIRSWNVTIFSRYYVMSCYDLDLTLWPWTFVVVRASCDQTLCKIWAKSNNPLQSYWRFSYLFPKGGISILYSSEGGGPISIKFGENRAVSSTHSPRNFGSDMLLRFEMTAAQKWAMSKSRPNFTHFDPL